MIDVRKAPSYVRLALEMRRFLAQPLDEPAAERLVRAGLAARADRLLSLVRDRIEARADSPYRALLRHAGVTYQDVAGLVARDGVDETLRQLAAAGVWLSLAEFKGRAPIRRGSLELAVAPRALDGAGGAGLTVRSGATRSAGTPTLIGLGLLTEEAAHRRLFMRALDAEIDAVGIWLPILPGSAGIKNVLRHTKLGAPPERWFSQAPVTLGGRDSSAWLTQAVLRLGRLYGARLPLPEYVPLDDAGRVLAWVVDQVRAGRRCLIVTYVSSAVRVCAAAAAASQRLDGVCFILVGEPVTPARAAAVHAVGAGYGTTYSMAETGSLGWQCVGAADPDDVHLLLDRVALVHPPTAGPLPPSALLLTALSPHAPKVMFNVETGDAGRLRSRPCACRLHALGFDQHLDSVTSYEKLSGEGMTYDATALVEVIEAALPARFGGGPADYQMLEEEEAGGLTRLTLLVSPRVGPLDEAAVLAATRAALDQGPAGQRLAALLWGQADLLRVRRDEPRPTPRGKVLPFQVYRRDALGAAPEPPGPEQP
jgi:hypothetical protein